MGVDPLLRAEQPSGDPQPDHKGIETLQFFFRPLFSSVPVVLLVHTMKFDQGLVVFPERPRDFILQALGQRSPQCVTFLLDLFNNG